MTNIITKEERSIISKRHSLGPGGVFYADQYRAAISDIARLLAALEAAEDRILQLDRDLYAVQTYQSESEAHAAEMERQRDRAINSIDGSCPWGEVGHAPSGDEQKCESCCSDEGRKYEAKDCWLEWAAQKGR